MPTPIDPRDAVILITEDNDDNLIITSAYLEKMQVRYVEGRASGREMFELIDTLRDMPIHLILLDLKIPNEDGYTILQQIRQHPQLRDTLVVALTANVMVTDVERAQKAGFNGFIGKPTDRRRFPGQIERILRGEAVWDPR